jgi:hypothetical protein
VPVETASTRFPRRHRWPSAPRWHTRARR